MTSFARTDRSEINHWWWTVDRWSLLAVVVLMGIGAVLVLAASPAAAGRMDLGSFQLAVRHMIFLVLALLLMLGVSLLPTRWVRRTALLGLAASLLLCALTLLTGTEVKGASRWITFAGQSLQPSEFLKPCFVVAAAWLFTLEAGERQWRGMAVGFGLWLVVSFLLLCQPDFGQFALITLVWGFQLFLAGLPHLWIGLLILLGLASLVGSYFLLPHVASRIESFLDPTVGDHYQISRSLQAFANGGLFGRGPGEGTVKQSLPDSHSDFIFAVAGEEFGLVVCLLILCLFAFVVLRGFGHALRDRDLFAAIATSGLLAIFGLQALINMGSSLRLVPTKGMTLPLISYGGSSLLAIALTLGMVLALTRRSGSMGALE